jgi:hypothetical protein
MSKWFLQACASGSSADTIVINNEKRKWLIIDTMDDFNMRYSTDIYEIFQGTKRAANLNI